MLFYHVSQFSARYRTHLSFQLGKRLPMEKSFSPGNIRVAHTNPPPLHHRNLATMLANVKRLRANGVCVNDRKRAIFLF